MRAARKAALVRLSYLTIPAADAGIVAVRTTIKKLIFIAMDDPSHLGHNRKYHRDVGVPDLP